MSNWILLTIKFKDYENTMLKLHSSATQEKPIGVYRDLICYLKNVVNALNNLLNRYFYLFEPGHLFLALEIKDMSNINFITDRINQVEKPHFVNSIEIDLDSGDEDNGEVAIDFFHSCTKHAFLRIEDDYKPGYENNDETKLVHCFCNQLFVDWDSEIKFYIKCIALRGAKRLEVQMKDNKIYKWSQDE